MTKRIRTFWESIDEASLQGNLGIPGEGGPEDKGRKYLSDVEARAQARNQELMRTHGRDMGNFMGLVGRARQIQRGKEAELEKLAEKIIRLLYDDILDGVELDIKFPKDQAIQKMMQDVPEKSDEPPALKELKDKGIISEIQKRKIGNNIIQGEAKNVKKALALQETLEGFVKIFGDVNVANEYRTLLLKISDIAGIFDWQIPMEVQLQMWTQDKSGFSGSVKVEWESPKKEEDEDLSKKILDDLANSDETPEDTKELFDEITPTVHALGTDFSMLIHETVKGIMELILANTIPDDEETAETVIMNTDSLADEIEDLRYGPEIAADLRDFINEFKEIDTIANLREKVFGKMMLMPAPDFLKLMYSILNQEASAKSKVQSIIDEISEEESEYRKQLMNWELGQSGEEPDEDSEEIAQIKAAAQAPVEEEPEEMDYSKLPQREIEKMIDKALDDKDYDKARELSTYLKESKRHEAHGKIHLNEGYPSNRRK